MADISGSADGRFPSAREAKPRRSEAADSDSLSLQHAQYNINYLTTSLVVILMPPHLATSATSRFCCAWLLACLFSVCFELNRARLSSFPKHQEEND